MLWVKAFHIVFVVTWFAGLFYLPRLFVHHSLSADAATRERLAIMERKLYRFTTPSMIAVVGFGLWTASFNWEYYREASWFWIKMALVSVLLVYHFTCGYYVRQFAQDTVKHGHIFFRWFNELPVVILIAAVLLAVVKAPL